MNKLFLSTKRLILSKQNSIASSAMIVGLMILLSRFFGFLRYRTLANYFDKDSLDIFFASFRIPDIIFEILITGAITSSLIPIFIKYQKNKETLDENISSIINIISLVFLCIIAIIFIFADLIIPFTAPGFSAEKINLIVFFSRILLLSQLPFLVFANFLTGIGQANKTFIISSLAPIAYNIVIILATVFFAPSFHLLAPILGVSAGSAALFLLQAPLLFSSEFVYKPVLKITRGVKEFFRMIVPRVVTVITSQIDATIDLILTSMLGAGSYTIFYLAQHLQLLPVSVIGIAFGQASLPYLSEVFQQKKFEEFKKIIIESIVSIFFLTVPIMSFFIFARTPLIRLFFGGDKFDWDATVQTAFTLSYFSLSIPFHSVYYFLTRCYFAFLDSKTPFLISVFSVILNIILSLLFIYVLKLPVWALGASFSISIFLNVLLLHILLTYKLKGLNNTFLLRESFKILLATFVASFFVWWGMKILDGLILDTTRTINVFLLLVIGGVSYLALFLYLAWLFEIKEISIIRRFLNKAKVYRRKVIEIYTEVE